MEASGTPQPYPLRIEGDLDPALSRWLWLVKWLLVIPHFVVLVFLWIAFVGPQRRRVLRDPLHRPLPARHLRLQRRRAALDVARRLLLPTARSAPTATRRSRSTTSPTTRPRSRSTTPSGSRAGSCSSSGGCSRIPHYLVVGIFVGGAGPHGRATGGTWAAAGPDRPARPHRGVALLFTAATRAGSSTSCSGMNRWVFRVAAYAALMTDRYPPFRLDQGPTDVAPEARLFEPAAVAEPAAAEVASKRKWTAGRIVAIVVGSILALISLGLLAGGESPGMVYDLNPARLGRLPHVPRASSSTQPRTPSSPRPWT